MRTKIKLMMLLLALFVIRVNAQSLTINSITKTDASSCSACNGSAVANVSGGFAPYTYYWSNSFSNHTHKDSNLCPGTYYLNVYDSHGDSASGSGLVIIGPPPIIINTSSTNSACSSNTGTVTANVSGGNAPYTYFWTPGGGTTATVTGLGAGTYTVIVRDANGCIVSDSATVYSGSSLFDSVSTTNATCGNNTGTITASTYGGTAPYTYLWSPGGQTTATITGLSSGTYSLTVTDAHGCSYSNIAYVGVTGLTVSLSETNVLCTGPNTGTATVSGISGGSSPYTYLWSPSGQTNATATGLSAGTYSVTVTDTHGCNGSASIYVGSWTPIVSDTFNLVTGASCSNNDGSAYVQFRGGSTPYTYSWNPSGETTATATGLSSGSYTVTLTDVGGCSATASIFVPLTGPVPSISTTEVTCNGGSNGSATINSVSGGVAPYTYSWAPVASTNSSISGLSAGIYTVTTTDSHGCTGTTTVNIYQPAPLTFYADTMPDSGSCSGAVYIRVSGGTMPYTYTWSAPVNMVTDSLGEYTDSLCAGAYLVCITDGNGCSNCDSIHIRHSPHVLGIGNIKNSTTGIKVYPNPVSDQLNIGTDGLEAGSYTLYAYDMIGRQVLQNKNITINPGQTLSLNVSGLPSGKYMLRISGTSSNKIAPFIVVH